MSAGTFRKQSGRGDEVAISEDKVSRWAESLFDVRNEERLAYWLDARGVPGDTLRDLQIGWDGRRRRYTIPVRDSSGRCVDVKLYRPGETEFGKSLHYTEKSVGPDGEAVSLGWGKPPRLWGLDRVAAASVGRGRAGVVLLCAGEPDALLATALGYLAVSPTSGEGSLCRAQDVKVLLKGGWPVRVLFDVDDAGRKAAGMWARALLEFGFENVKNIELEFRSGLEGGKDLTDWVMGDEWAKTGNYEDAGAALWAAIRAASKLDLADLVSRQGDSGSSDGTAAWTGEDGDTGAGTADGRAGDSSGAGDGAGSAGDSAGRRSVEELLEMALAVKLPEYGSRNRAGFWLWCQLRDERYTKNEALAWLDEWVQRVNAAAGAKPGHAYTKDESRLSLDEAYSVSPRDANGKGLSYPLTDLGNAERFVARHGADVAWVPAWDAWAVWDGRRWDRSLFAMKMVSEWAYSVPRMMYEEGLRLARIAKAMAGSGDGDEANPKATAAAKEAAKLMAWARASESAGKLNAIMSLGRSLATAKAEELDKDGNLINVENGVVQLGEFGDVQVLPFDRERRVTVLAPVRYDPLAESPMFDNFLKETLPDEEVREYLARLVGYSLIGGNPDRKFIIVQGPTASGKSTLSNILQNVLGRYAQPFKLSLMREKQDEGPRQDLLDLMPARIIFASEASESWHLHADQVKYLTGNEPITARGLYSRSYVVQRPAYTPWLLTNAIPHIKGADAALWRRLVAVQFGETRAVGTETRGLDLRIANEEAAGVLRWALEGYRQWRLRGLDDAPAAVLAHTMQVREELTELDQWLAECTESDREFSEFTEVLFDNYRTWCMANHIHERDQLTLRGFGKHLGNRGYEAGPRKRPDGAGRETNALRTRQGLRIRVVEKEKN